MVVVVVVLVPVKKRKKKTRRILVGAILLYSPELVGVRQHSKIVVT